MDMLVRLNKMSARPEHSDAPHAKDAAIRRAMAYEGRKVVNWVEENFNPRWADECAAAFGHQPIGCYIAVDHTTICGFCCFHTTFKNFIGPIGVHQDYRCQGVGRRLLTAVAHELYLSGFAYAVIGDVGEPEFFKKAAGAWEIPDSTPGAYPRKI